jgi:hypothetical protein
MTHGPDEASLHQCIMDDNNNNNKKKKVKLLASKYTQKKRIGEIISVCAYGVLISVSVLRISNVFFLKNIWVFLCACVLGMSVADFFSGIVHCMYLFSYYLFVGSLAVHCFLLPFLALYGLVVKDN